MLTFPTKVPRDSLGWIGGLKRTSDKSLFPMALGSCGHRITHQLRPINMNGRSILSKTSDMDCQATLSISVTQCDPTSATTPLHWPAPTTVHVSCPAKQLAPQQRRDLAIQVLAGTETVSELARQHEVSRKFLYQQVHTAEKALSAAFAPSSRPDDVLFYLPVTKAWLRQLVLGLVFICHRSVSEN